MTDRPPSPTTPQSTPTIGAFQSEIDPETGLLATTTGLADAIEDSLEVCPDEATLEEILVELDRRGYVDWVAMTRTGDYVWDFSRSPDRIAETISAAILERLHSWLDSHVDTSN